MTRRGAAVGSLVFAVATILVSGLLAGCGVLATPAPTTCDGIGSEIGGCDPDRPRFTGNTCVAVGQEAGRFLNDRLLPIYRGPDAVGGETRAVRGGQMMSLIVSLANIHLRQRRIIADCGVDEFIGAARGEFSDELKQIGGTYLYDGDPVPFDQWLVELRNLLSIIDMEEGASLAPA
ncbi:MAG: hypothetical protein M3R57_09770 [Chloroflexota bacterium]|nr:hypothetical protein [Chloroflexota bacterium]